jgi:hypothetical protein
MGTEPLHVVARVIVNLFKAGDTQLPGNYRGSPGINLHQDVYNMLRKRMESVARGLAAFRSKRSCTDNLFVLAHPQEAARPTTVYAFFLDVRKAYDTGGWAIRQVAEGVDEVMAGPARPSCEIHLTSQGEQGPVRSFSLSAGVGQGDPYLRCCSISLSMTSWLLHDTCSEHGICVERDRCSSCYMRMMRMHILHQWLAS